MCRLTLTQVDESWVKLCLWSTMVGFGSMVFGFPWYGVHDIACNKSYSKGRWNSIVNEIEGKWKMFPWLPWPDLIKVMFMSRTSILTPLQVPGGERWQLIWKSWSNVVEVLNAVFEVEHWKCSGLQQKICFASSSNHCMAWNSSRQILYRIFYSFMVSQRLQEVRITIMFMVFIILVFR